MAQIGKVEQNFRTLFTQTYVLIKHRKEINIIGTNINVSYLFSITKLILLLSLKTIAITILVLYQYQFVNNN